MRRVRLYFDADAMQRAVVTAVRARGVDVLTAREADLLELSDEAQLEFATRQSRVLFGYNASDYCRIHTEWSGAGRHHAGIILAPQQRYSVNQTVHRLLKLLAACSLENMEGRIEFLSNWQ